ncbi:GNAT family N-acetyltransferase [Deinococcus malanensis]|uniref:GNAT family N-acetyltransferase n=1 Tax=Deinococcus malanensis TaxID=1706855 RepID=UPI00362BBDE7
MDLGIMLEARGLREVFREVALYAPASAARQALASSTRAFPEVSRVGPDHAVDVATFITGQFGLPSEMTELLQLGLSHMGWMGYFVPGEVGVSSAGFLTVGGRAALLHTAATRPDSRGQGGQSALILRRLQEGLAQGCEHFLVDVEAGQDNPSRRNLERLGFRPVFEVPFYTAAEPAD